ncbi:MAG: DUF1002 domain-containing protein [Eubacteriales bacterium]|nr:DUF1002 domain-containing protein [Eubacteriales bacterium]
MKKMKLFAALVCSAGLALGSAAPAMADASKVVTLGSDLTQEQKNTMMRYFNVSQNEARILLITNQDERNHLLGYAPESQIGTRTLSCAYVKPTQSGGIKVRTANLNWVTCNMIASSLSTAGVKNCEVVAACPIEVSGTGALTGVQMAYESATGQPLDPTKKKLAAQEVVVTERYATDVGKKAATNVVNKAKMNVIQNNVTNNNEIYNIVVNIALENNYNITEEQAEEITDFLEKVSDQDYEYEDVKETLETVDDNLNGTVSEEGEVIENETLAADEDSILNEVDSTVFEEDVIEDSTDDPTLAEETGASDEVIMSEEDMNFQFDENLADQTIEALETETPIDDIADGGLSEADAVDSENTIEVEPETEQITVDPEMDADGLEVNAEDPSDSIPQALPESENTDIESVETENTLGTEEEVNTAADSNSNELNTDLLSEQAKSQFVKAQAFCKGEYEGDYNQLNTAVGEDAYNYTYGFVILDQVTGQAVSKAIETYYYNVLNGTTQYYADGTEQFMNMELNAMNQYLKQFFGLQNGTPDAAAAAIMEADRTTLYNDSIRFFSNLYGEMVTDNTEIASESYGEEIPSDNIENMGEGYDQEVYDYDGDDYY